jgi:uncharacterized protein involved in outer membrane biogenesis
MAEPKEMPNSPVPLKRRHSRLKLLGWIAGGLIVLLIGVYFAATSSACFKSVILPRVSKALNAEVTVSDASVSPFSRIVLHNLKVQTTSTEPLIAAPEVRVRYSLMNILGGNIHVDELALVSPTVTVVENPDGTSNLDPILNELKKKPQPAKPAQPTRLDLRQLALTDATIRYMKFYAGGNRDVTEFAKLSVNVEGVKNGQTGKLTMSSDVNIQNNSPPPGASGLLQAKLDGSYAFGLSADLQPTAIKGTTHLEVTRAEGALAQWASVGSDLDCDVTPADIRQAALRLQKGNLPLGQLRVSGPFDLEKTEGRFRVEILSIDKGLLNLVGASSGLDFGTTTLNSSNEIQVAKSGSLITAGGQLELGKLQLIRTNQTSPTLDLRAAYSLTVDRAQSNALLQSLVLIGTQLGNPLLRAELAQPMNIAWGKAANAVGDSTLQFTVAKLDLADWKPFLGGLAPGGIVNAQLKLVSQQAGQQLAFGFSSQIDNLTVNVASNQIAQATITGQANGTASQLTQFNLQRFRFQVVQQNQPLVTLDGSGTYDRGNETADLQVTLQMMLAGLLRVLPQPDVTVSSGTAELKGRLSQEQKQQSLSGNFTLVDFTGRSGKNEFRGFGTTADFDVGMTPQQIQIRKLTGNLTQGTNAGGSFSFSGNYDLTNRSTQFKAELTRLNQNGLRPVLEPMLADKKLVSVDLNATLAGQYNPEGDSTIKGDLQVTNVVVRDSQNQSPATPIEAKLQLDASLRKQVVDLRQLALALTPTSRASNQVQLVGQVDMSHTNAIQGNLKLAADSLDLTSYYDLFSGQTKTTAPKPVPGPTQTNATPVPAGPEREPDAQQLPFRTFTAAASIRRLYLHEVEAADLQATLKLESGRVALEPFKLKLNGAPVDATLDLNVGVPGYKYALSLNAQAVPLAPLVNSFQPERKGQMGGALNAQATVNGAGITGTSLQKNLNGRFDVASTNLNLAVVNIRNPLLRTLINVVATIPELLRSPGSASLGTLLQGVTGAGGGGLTGDLEKSPIDKLSAKGAVGGGVVDLQQANVSSSTFQADATGTVTLAAILSNSAVQIPVSVSLGRSIADRLNLVPANTPTNAPYIRLPDFLALKGTLGNPKADINKLALAGTVLKGVGATIPSLGTKADSLLPGLGGILGGSTPAKTNAAPNLTTNQPPAKPASRTNLLDQLLKP